MAIGKYHAVKCRCGHRACRDWHVGPMLADVQGVHFTEEQARLVAALLNRLEDRGAEGGPSWTFHDALRAVLLFHDAAPWGAAKRAEWLRITGTAEATTRTLCDHARRVLAAGSCRPKRAEDESTGDAYFRLYGLEVGHVLTEADVVDVGAVLEDYNEELGEADGAFQRGRLDALREVGGGELVEAVETKDEMFVAECTARVLERLRAANEAKRSS